MVRPRIQLEKLEGDLSREHYYLHNKSIVTKKVREMSVLTGADVLFIGFSPGGNPSVHLGEKSNFMNIVRKFSRVSFNDGEKRRHDNIQTLKANYQKEEGYNIEVDKLFNAWKVKRLEGMHDELKRINNDLIDAHQKKRLLDNPEKVMSIEKLKEMEKSLQTSLDGLRKRKEEMMSKQKNAIESTVEPFDDFIPEMLSGNDELLAYANILMSDNEASTSYAQS